jgi:hypothetical protein
MLINDKNQNTNLVFGINIPILALKNNYLGFPNQNVRFLYNKYTNWYIYYICSIKLNIMSEELINFSEQIDEQFDIADVKIAESDDLLEAIVNLFI